MLSIFEYRSYSTEVESAQAELFEATFGKLGSSCTGCLRGFQRSESYVGGGTCLEEAKNL